MNELPPLSEHGSISLSQAQSGIRLEGSPDEQVLPLTCQLPPSGGTIGVDLYVWMEGSRRSAPALRLLDRMGAPCGPDIPLTSGTQEVRVFYPSSIGPAQLAVVVAAGLEFVQLRLDGFQLKVLHPEQLYAQQRERLREPVSVDLRVERSAGWLEDVLASLLPQTDRIRVHMDASGDRPRLLHHRRVSLVVPGGPLTPETEPCFRVFARGDIIFPPDFVESCVDTLRRMGRHAVVGVTGGLLRQPVGFFTPDRTIIDLDSQIVRERPVHFLDSNVLCVYEPALEPEVLAHLWRASSVASPVARVAQDASLPLVIAPRPQRWLQARLEPPPDGGPPEFADAAEDLQASALPCTIHSASRARMALVLIAQTPEATISCHATWLETRSEDFEWVVIVALAGSGPGLRHAVEGLAIDHEIHVVGSQPESGASAVTSALGLVARLRPAQCFVVRDCLRFVCPGWDCHIVETGFKYGLGAVFASGTHSGEKVTIHAAAQAQLGSPLLIAYSPERARHVVLPTPDGGVAGVLWNWSHYLRRAGLNWLAPEHDVGQLADYLAMAGGESPSVAPGRLKACLMLLGCTAKGAAAALKSWQETRSRDLDWTVLILPASGEFEPVPSRWARLFPFKLRSRTAIEAGVGELARIHSGEVICDPAGPANSFRNAVARIEEDEFAFAVVITENVRFRRPGWDEHLLRAGFDWSLGAIFVTDSDDPRIGQLRVTGRLEDDHKLPLLSAFDPIASRRVFCGTSGQSLGGVYRDWLEKLARNGVTWREPGQSLSKLATWIHRQGPVIRAKRPAGVQLQSASAAEPVSGASKMPHADHSTSKLRFCLNIACPRTDDQFGWGDFYFARSLARALERQNHETRIAAVENWYRKHDGDEAILVLRGLERYYPNPDQVSLMWIISHPELVSDEEIRSFDHVFVASAPYCEQLKARGLQNVSVLLQCTDPAIFHPGERIPALAYDVLFVGKTRGIDRPTVTAAVEAGLDLAVFGQDWLGRLDPRLIKGQEISNERLGCFYRSARTVLNDHWPDMRREGFVSNRVFDVLACGTPLVSDSMIGLPQELSDFVYVFHDSSSFADAVSCARNESPSRLEQRRRLGHQVTQGHSFDQRAAEILLRARASQHTRSRS